jgi:hypothetical protein
MKKVWSVMLPAHFSVHVFVEASDEEGAIDLAMKCAHHDTAEFNDWGHPQDVEALVIDEKEIPREHIYISRGKTRRAVE